MPELDDKPRMRRCSWHKTDHPIEDFNPGQRWCKQGMTEYKRVLRGASKEDAVGPVAYRSPEKT